MKKKSEEQEEKPKLDEINEKFQEEVRSGCQKLYNYLSDFIEKKLVDDKLIDDKFQEVIACEKRADKLKDQYLELLFKDKKALPFLVEERYKIITSLDKIANKSEIIARYMMIFPFEIYDDLREDFIALNKLYMDITNQLLNCTLLMETKFDSSYELTFEIENLRRESHDLKFRMFESLFKKTDNVLRINLTWKLIGLLYDVISCSEEISDFLRCLIIKYPEK